MAETVSLEVDAETEIAQVQLLDLDRALEALTAEDESLAREDN